MYAHSGKPPDGGLCGGFAVAPTPLRNLRTERSFHYANVCKCIFLHYGFMHMHYFALQFYSGAYFRICKFMRSYPDKDNDKDNVNVKEEEKDKDKEKEKVNVNEEEEDKDI